MSNVPFAVLVMTANLTRADTSNGGQAETAMPHGPIDQREGEPEDGDATATPRVAAARSSLRERRLHLPRTRAPVAGTEAETLLGELKRQRRLSAWKCSGLEAAGLQATLGPSVMTLGGLLKHIALVEDDHFARPLLAESPGEPWSAVDFDTDPDWEWRTAIGDSPEELTCLWQEMVELSRRRVAEAVAVAGMEAEGRHVTRGGQLPLLRRIVVDMISEYARHLGHADLIRESVDGLARSRLMDGRSGIGYRPSIVRTFVVQ